MFSITCQYAVPLEAMVGRRLPKPFYVLELRSNILDQTANLVSRRSGLLSRISVGITKGSSSQGEL
jgi:hypothetical protein